MRKNWYLLYVTENSQKRVSVSLSKKKIENFCPLTCIQTMQLRTIRVCYKPLFGPYLFAHLSEDDFSLIKKVKNVVNVVYWMNKPAIITDEEIAAIKEFTGLHQNISIEKYQVNNNESIRIIDAPYYSISENLILVKANLTKVHLPSLRLEMTVKIEMDTTFGEKEIKAESSFWKSNNKKNLELSPLLVHPLVPS